MDSVAARSGAETSGLLSTFAAENVYDQSFKIRQIVRKLVSSEGDYVETFVSRNTSHEYSTSLVCSETVVRNIEHVHNKLGKEHSADMTGDGPAISLVNDGQPTLGGDIPTPPSAPSGISSGGREAEHISGAKDSQTQTLAEGATASHDPGYLDYLCAGSLFSQGGEDVFWGGTAPPPPINRSAGPVGGSAPRPHSDVAGKAAFPCGPGGAAAVNVGLNSSAGGAMSQGPKMAPCGQNESVWVATVKIGGDGETPGKDPQRKDTAGKKMKRKPNKRERREKQQKAKEDRKETHVRKVAARLERTRELKGQGWTRGRIKSHWKKVGRTSEATCYG